MLSLMNLKRIVALLQRFNANRTLHLQKQLRVGERLLLASELRNAITFLIQVDQ